MPLLEEKELQEGITVTVTYKDLAGETYQSQWNLNPYIYRDGRYVQHKGVADVARGVEKLSSDLRSFLQRQESGDGAEQG